MCTFPCCVCWQLWMCCCPSGRCEYTRNQPLFWVGWFWDRESCSYKILWNWPLSMAKKTVSTPTSSHFLLWMWNMHVKDKGFGQNLCVFVLRVKKLKLIIPHSIFFMLYSCKVAQRNRFLCQLYMTALIHPCVPSQSCAGSAAGFLLSNSDLLQTRSLDRRS